ncbi:hypothetical protein BO94DRAFT_539837 [Aspergillus sclerotioniger CBS 115572]|uniref:Uncharacterized protein n=1 Tax=Aspergillus sclerotioniger CBS 115572 TaxID=1450535 RepID=A0A317VAI2_9EURO|nr:hypothetical protein BO94DRAFT_539837 [Aspergillus sclerotioniger CBS 115572]PWY70369.1 hypothetical protein BO94DRAFT_539837 [Aspergillus sclerotioniger CBS 115572]
MACLNNRLSYASWRLRVFRQLFRPNGSHPALYHSKSTSRNGTPLSDVLEFFEDEEEVKRRRRMYPSRRPSESLPQSPLITNPRPGYDKLHKKKRRPDPTESNIHLNPWAQALASPVRACKVTGVRMPRALLSEWGSIKRPDVPDKLWLLPVGLMKDKFPIETVLSKKSASKATNNNPNSVRHLTLRIVDRLPLLRTITDAYWGTKHARNRSPLAKLIPHRWKHPAGPMTPRDEGQLTWREDMPEFALRMMRQNVLKVLKKASDESSTQPEKRKVWTDIPMKQYGRSYLSRRTFSMEPFDRMECSAVLVLNRRKAKPGRITGLYPRMPNEVFVSWEKKTAPVFDLTVMLSDEELQELKAHHPRFENTALLFRPDNKATIDAMLALWKLRGFIRDDRVLEPPPLAYNLKSIWRSRYLL